MNQDTGEIRPMKDLLDEFGVNDSRDLPPPWKEMRNSPTGEQMKRTPPKVGRNELCPCGSGKKFKKCCLSIKGGGEI